MKKEMKPIEDIKTYNFKGNVGGCQNPTQRLKVVSGGFYGIGTTAPQTYIQLNAKSLRDAWRKLISLTTHMLLEKIGIK